MSQSIKTVKQVGLLQLKNGVSLNDQGVLKNGTSSFKVSSSGVELSHSNVTQGTSATTAVTVAGSAGVITTFASTLAAVSSESFTVNNTAVSADSVVVVSIVDYSGTYGTNGLPSVAVSSVAAGSFAVNIINSHATAPLAGTLEISYIVV